MTLSIWMDNVRLHADDFLDSQINLKGFLNN